MSAGGVGGGVSERFQRMGDNLRGEAEQKAKQRAVAIFGPQPSGTTDVGRKQYLELVQRNWPDQGFLAGLLTRVGPKQFRETALAAMGWPEDAWPLPGDAPKAAATTSAALPPMSDYQAQMLENDRLRTLMQEGQHD